MAINIGWPAAVTIHTNLPFCSTTRGDAYTVSQEMLAFNRKYYWYNSIGTFWSVAFVSKPLVSGFAQRIEVVHDFLQHLGRLAILRRNHGSDECVQSPGAAL
jgi:hypothetical protein